MTLPDWTEERNPFFFLLFLFWFLVLGSWFWIRLPSDGFAQLPGPPPPISSHSPAVSLSRALFNDDDYYWHYGSEILTKRTRTEGRDGVYRISGGNATTALRRQLISTLAPRISDCFFFFFLGPDTEHAAPPMRPPTPSGRCSSPLCRPFVSAWGGTLQVHSAALNQEGVGQEQRQHPAERRRRRTRTKLLDSPGSLLQVTQLVTLATTL